MSKHRTRRTMWSRLLSGVLCLALTLGLLPASGLVQTAEAHWADPYGQKLVEWGVMNPSSNLRLDSTITRAEFVAMCNRAFGYKKLGSMPFVDVASSAWYAQDINIAYNAGYFNGTTSNPSRPTASPNGTLTREQAAVLIARNLMLQETVGESLGFTDSRTLSEWSRGLIGAAVAEGMIGGYEDGSYRPTRSITRGEVAKMLVSVIGTPINKAGSYELGDVYGNVTISSSNVTLRNTVIAGNLYVTGGVDLGNVLLENVTVLGRVVISGGGEGNSAKSSVILRNVTADEMVVDSLNNQFVTISAYGVNNIPVTRVRSDAYLDDSSWEGYGLYLIELDGAPGTKLQLAGTIKEVINKTPFSNLQLVQGTAQKITIDEYATNAQLLIDEGTRVGELNLDVATIVTGKGDIGDLNIFADNCEVDILPDNVTIRPGITADVAGETMGSLAASEMSADPRLLAGYPAVKNVAPTTAEIQFAVNKPGTIYWAISEIADGSVTEDNLIDHPAYGSNIFADQYGSITASANNVYVQQITGLVPDGRYYISAIMVDGRDKRSPLKVAAFTTPDDTVPAFVGTPEMTRTTCTVAQVTATANKSCLLYWALLPKDAACPTAQEFKSGSLGGNFGYGSVSVVKNVPVSITVNTQRLQEDTEYWLYLWLTDHNGAQSMALPVQPIKFRTPDETPPVVSSPIQTDAGDVWAEVSFSINEYPASLYWAVVTDSNESFITPGATPEETAEIMSALRTKIKVESGSGSIIHGSTPVTGANVETKILKSVLTGLSYEEWGTHLFKLYYVGKDAAGNYSDPVRYIEIYTLDTDPPHVWLSFSEAVGGSPRANSDVRIVFDERVKGGVNATHTFLELYEEVEKYANLVNNYPDNPNIDSFKENLSNAKKEMAKALDEHIKLYSMPNNGGSGTLVKTNADPGNTTDDWTVNWCEAIVTMEKGNMVITLPGETRVQDGVNMVQAIKMGSGATYQFVLRGVFDDASPANPIAVDALGTCITEGSGVTNDAGNGTIPKFTTLYAQVELRENGLTKINSAGNLYNGYRLDVCVDVSPLSTSSVPETEFWDMIMWCDTLIKFEIYRKTVDSQGNVTDWELVSNEITYDPGSDNGVSFSFYRKDVSPKIQTVVDGLKEKATYTYGIHFTEVNKISEGTSHTEDPEAWGGSVTMWFSVVAGGERPITGLSTATSQYDKYVKEDKTVSEIGLVYTSTGTDTILTCTPREFVDTQPPSFAAGYPTFTASSARITMTVNTESGRTGTMYYVVAPAPNPGASSTLTSVSTSVGGTQINVDNDSKLEGKTYIPTDGTDRVRNQGNIQFMTGGANNTPGEYDSPKSTDITNISQYDQVSDIIKAKRVSLNGMITPFDIEGLRPDTWYYVYIVFQGAGRANNIVEIYRVKTDTVERPVVTISANGSIVTMTPTQDCELAFALVEKNSTLEDWIKGTDSTSSGYSTDTILDQMVKRQSQTNAPSWLDDNPNATLKLNMVTYVSGSGNTGGGNTGSTSDFRNWVLPRDLDGQTYNGVKYDKSVPVSANVPITWDFNDYMTEGADYVVLVAARHFYGGYGGDDYGFAAVTDLHKQDTVPPKFKNKDSNNAGFLDASLSPYNPNGEVWTDHPENYAYSGSVAIEFTKDLYYFDDTSGVRKLYKVVFDPKPTNPDEKYILDILGGTAVDNGRVSVTQTKGPVGNTITLKLANIRMGDTITFFRTGQISNGSSVFDSGVKLTLTFDPTLTAKDIRKNGKAELLMPGFWADWG